MRAAQRVHSRALLMLFVLLIAATAVSSSAATVSVKIAATGSAVPGATVSAKATVTTSDNSTVQSITWAHAGGVDVTMSGTTGDTINITLPGRKAYREELAKVLEEPPVTAAELPAHIPYPTAYEGGLQDRFVVTGISNEALVKAGEVEFDFTIVTSSGTYHASAALATTLPWHTATGIRNIPILVPVLLHGKTQASYNWTLTVPSGSATTLTDANTQNPEFTPDIPGTYVAKVMNLETNTETALTIYAGTWRGIITGQTSSGKPIAEAMCTGCHVPNTPNFDMFTPWSQTGHAEIFSQNVNTPNGHYGENCLECHSVGHNKAANNGGMDDAADYSAFVSSGIMAHGDAGNWTRVLGEFAQTAKLANIQCENCHGPQNSTAHQAKEGSRVTISADVCGSCHGEPTRHGRFQQWQLSGHANFGLAKEEGTDPTCGKCHSGQGFLQWQDKSFSSANLTVTWTTDDVQPQTCAVCHDPHSVGSTTDKTTNAKMRVYGDTPMLDAGFKATDVGNGAMCMTCHNSRRGLRDEAHYNPAQAERASHVGPQADILMGQNLYFTQVGQRGHHAMIEDTCVTCHMVKSTPPPTLSNNLGGTNHTFFASKTICTDCHSNVNADEIQGAVMAKMATLKSEIEAAIFNTMQLQIRKGNAIAIGSPVLATLRNTSDFTSVEFVESHGSQGIAVHMKDGTKLADTALTAVKVIQPAGGSVNLYKVTSADVPKAGWNYFMINSDASKGVHNPAFVNSALDISIFAVKTYNKTQTDPINGSVNPEIGGGMGNGAGAVTCDTPYVYWAELAAHAPGINNSQWRTDLVARNLNTSNAAAVRFILHQDVGDLAGTGSINASAQSTFEDIVATMGGTTAKGSLEICSNQPLLVLGRNLNDTGSGTFGQNFDGHVADLGYVAGDTVSLLGLRQNTNLYRSNLSVTNGGKTPAQVAIALYDATGTQVASYTLQIAPGMVVQEVEPFTNRAARPDIGWGFATVTVLSGTNIQASASMIDSRTNDPSTIEAKR